MDYLSITKEIVLKHIDGQNHKVFLFGSRAVGNVSNFSDIDIGDMETKRTDHRTTFQMVHEPEESSVTYNVNMELIDKYSIVLNS